MKVVKRDGKIVDFSSDKIKIAISKSAAKVNEMSDSDINRIVEIIVNKCERLNLDQIGVEQIQDIVEEVGFVLEARRQIFECILAYEGEQAVDVHRLTEVLDGETTSVLAGILSKNVPEGDSEKIIEDCLRQMKKSFLEKEYEKHRLLADEFERSGDERFLSELMESQRIKNEIKELY